MTTAFLFLSLMHAKLLQFCLALRDPMNCSLRGSTVHGILQARVLEWEAIPSSRGSSGPRERTCISCYLLHWQADSLTAESFRKSFYLQTHTQIFFVCVVKINVLFEFREGSFQWQTENKVERVWMKAGRMRESLILSR